MWHDLEPLLLFFWGKCCADGRAAGVVLMFFFWENCDRVCDLPCVRYGADRMYHGAYRSAFRAVCRLISVR